ncbi:hypothetical protein PGH46_13715 [Legionella pneumophila]|nr:hypothetical protein PGH46_13715 [Legionella pneumophila]
MDNSFVFNETTLKRVPHFLVLIIILLLGLPYIGLNWGLDFSNLAITINDGKIAGSQLIESQFTVTSDKLSYNGQDFLLLQSPCY